VKSVGAAVNQFLDKGGELRTSGPLGGEALDLLISGNLTSEEEPEKSFGERLLTTGGPGELGLAVGDSKTTEADTLI
jgi:hypothetical protein